MSWIDGMEIRALDTEEKAMPGEMTLFFRQPKRHNFAAEIPAFGLLRNSESLCHLGIEKALADAIGLDPFAVDDELGDGALAGAVDDLIGGAGGGFYVDVLERDVVFREKALGDPAVGAPVGRIDE